MRIGFDFDGVLYLWTKYAYDHLKRFKGETRSYEDVWSHYKEYYKESEIAEIAKISDYYNQEKLDYNTKRSIITLSDELVDIFYVTSRPGNCEEVTLKWVLESGLPQTPNLYVTKDKVQVIRALDLDFYVEDLPEYIEKLKEFTTVLIVDQPWNKGVEGKRFNSAEDAINFIIAERVYRKARENAN